MGVDPFLDMGRSATNVMSNAMGAAIVGRWEGEHYGEGCHGKPPVAVVEMAEPEPLKKQAEEPILCMKKNTGTDFHLCFFISAVCIS